MAQAEGGKPGAFESLAQYLEVRNSECLNESDDHPFANCLEVCSQQASHNLYFLNFQDGESSLQSDCDEQLILSLAFNQVSQYFTDFSI